MTVTGTDNPDGSGVQHTATVGADGALGTGIVGPATVGGTDANRALVNADGELVTNTSITVDTITATDVNVKGTASPDGTGTHYYVVVHTDGSIDVNVLNPGLTDTELRASAVPVDASGSTVPVSGPLTDAQLRATPVPVAISSEADAAALDVYPARYNTPQTVTFPGGGNTRSLSITVIAGAPTWNGFALPVGITVSAGVDFPGDTLVSIPDLVLGDGDDVFVTIVDLD